LPAEQRARVDKWLFDKGMTYQQVADGCLKMFGLKVSKSSVGRYYGAESLRRMGRNGTDATIRRMGPIRPTSKSGVQRSARPTNIDSSEPLASPEERWQELLARMTKRALDLATYLTLEWDDEASREMLQITKVLIAARRERTDGMMAQLYRKRFEMWAAKEVYKHYVKRLKSDSLQRGDKRRESLQRERARTQNERFREEIQQAVEQAMASEKIREEYKRQHFDGTWHD
jgi:hypothetical protein